MQHDLTISLLVESKCMYISNYYNTFFLFLQVRIKVQFFLKLVINDNVLTDNRLLSLKNFGQSAKK